MQDFAELIRDRYRVYLADVAKVDDQISKLLIVRQKMDTYVSSPEFSEDEKSFMKNQIAEIDSSISKLKTEKNELFDRCYFWLSPVGQIDLARN